jgi:hypothetical protein
MDDVGMDGIDDSAVPDLISSTLISEDSVKKSFPIVKSPSTDIKSILLIVHKAKKKTVRFVIIFLKLYLRFFKVKKFDTREKKVRLKFKRCKNFVDFLAFIYILI